MNYDPNSTKVKIPADYQARYLDVAAFYPRARTLDISDTHIHQIDISGCKHLTDLICSRSHIKMLDVFNHPSLRIVTAKDMPQLHNLYLQECKNLREVNVTSKIRFYMDLRGCSKLYYVSASKTKLVNICLHECESLTFLDCSHTSLIQIDLNQNPLLHFVNLSNTPMFKMKMKYCHYLQHIFVRGTNIERLDLMMCKQIKTLDIRGTNRLSVVLMKSSVSAADALYKNKILNTN